MRIEPVYLDAGVCTLEPAKAEDAAGMAAFSTPELLEFMCMAPRDPNRETLGAYMAGIIDRGVNTLLTVRGLDGRVIGQTSYISASDDDNATEIGGTWYDAAVHGTAVNPACKLALLTHAFETVGVARVQFRGDNLNERSKRAVAALGATFEGVHRKHMPVFDADGTLERYRDSFVYAITDDDWPRCKAIIAHRVQKRIAPCR